MIDGWHCCSVAQLCPTHVTPWTAACQASLSFTISRSLFKLTSIASVMPSTMSCSVIPSSSCHQSFPTSESFLMSQFFASRGQNIGASASVLPMNIQDWFPLGLTDLISCSSRNSQDFLQHHSSETSFCYDSPYLWCNKRTNSHDLILHSNEIRLMASYKRENNVCLVPYFV